MIHPDDFYRQLKAANIGLFTGVPDSLLSSLCAYVDDRCSASEHIIAANEGNAIALAMGYYLSSGNYAAVYMQNSGLGNAINPLTSLADPQVYRVPMLLIIGWRGEPGVSDEPQHIKQGRITPGQLALLEIPHQVLDSDSDGAAVLARALSTLADTEAPVALLVRKNAFSPYTAQRPPAQRPAWTREQALAALLDACGDDLIVCTTGKASRELFELRAQRCQAQRDFLTVGGMGHTASLALGVALGNPHKRVICVDGDGSVLMHMGALPIIGSRSPRNFIHVLLNNAAHESVGGQSTVADRVDFAAIARACGYAHYAKADNADSLVQAWPGMLHQAGPAMLELCIGTGSRGDLGRPTSSPEHNKLAFIQAART